MELAEFLKECRIARGKTLKEIASVTKIPVATLQKYEAGTSAVDVKRLGRLKNALCSTEHEVSKFDQLAKKVSEAGFRGPVDIRGESPELRVAPLPLFAPFSGDERSCWVDHFFRSFASFGGFTLKEPEVVRNAHAEKPPRFDVRERLDWISSGEVDIAYNLITPQRERFLNFISLPIRLSLAGIVFVGKSTEDDRDRRALLKQARAFLDSFLLPQNEMERPQTNSRIFDFVTIKDEVGDVYLRQLGLEPIRTQASTLHPETLASELRNTSKILLCDEHTAMQVVRIAGDELSLLLPPTSQEALMYSRARRATPQFFFGIGYRRINNASLHGYLPQAISSYISMQTEQISHWYFKLYEQLVAQYSDALSKRGLYEEDLVGRIPNTDDALALQRIKAKLLNRRARATARYVLNLSSRALSTLPPELQSWLPVLIRTRELLLASEGKDRDEIRWVLAYYARLVCGLEPFGVEPLQTNKESAALSAQNPSNEVAIQNDDTASTAEGVRLKEDEDLQSALFFIEHEFDITFDPSYYQTLRMYKDAPNKGIGAFITDIQEKLEDFYKTHPKPFISSYSEKKPPRDLRAFKRLVSEYCQNILDARQAAKMEAELTGMITGAAEKHELFVTYHLGREVGFAAAEKLGTDVPGGFKALQLKHYYLQSSLSHVGIGRRLIREMIRIAHTKHYRLIFFGEEDFKYDSQLIEGLSSLGFSPEWARGRLHYCYHLYQDENSQAELLEQLANMTALLEGSESHLDMALALCQPVELE